jgi:hypothetical protein
MVESMQVDHCFHDRIDLIQDAMITRTAAELVPRHSSFFGLVLSSQQVHE